MRCPNCKSDATFQTQITVNAQNATQDYTCYDCRAAFTVNGKVSIEWGAPTLTHIPTMTINDCLRRLKRTPLRRSEIPGVLFKAMLDKGLIRESSVGVVLKAPHNYNRRK